MSTIKDGFTDAELEEIDKVYLKMLQSEPAMTLESAFAWGAAIAAVVIEQRR